MHSAVTVDGYLVTVVCLWKFSTIIISKLYNLTLAEIWEVNWHTRWCTSSMCVVLLLTATDSEIRILSCMNSHKFTILLRWFCNNTQQDAEERLLTWKLLCYQQVPFGTMIALLCMWMGISLPLVFIGYFFGSRKQVIHVWRVSSDHRVSQTDKHNK